jgi:hypothetical protein
MLSSLEEVQVYTVQVKPSACLGWSGVFDFNPNAEDVAAAIRMDLAKLQPVQDFDQADIDHLTNALDLVECQSPDLPKHVKVAGMSLGWINVTGSEVFVKEVESMMPPLGPPTLTKGDQDNA